MKLLFSKDRVTFIYNIYGYIPPNAVAIYWKEKLHCVYIYTCYTSAWFLNDLDSTYLSKPKSRYLYLHLTIASLAIWSKECQAILPSACLYGTLLSVRLASFHVSGFSLNATHTEGPFLIPLSRWKGPLILFSQEYLSLVFFIVLNIFS